MSRTFEEIVAEARKRASEVKITNDVKKTLADKYNEQEGNMGFYDCSKCKNKGKIFFMEGDYLLSKDCECMAVRKAYKDIQKNNLEEQVNNYSFENYHLNSNWQKECYEKALAFTEDPKASMFYIGGNSGAGKTHLATAIYGKMVKSKFYRSKYMLWNEEAKRLLRLSFYDKEEYEEQVKELQEVKLLYIDDFFKPLGDSLPKEQVVGLAYDIINKRYANPKLITIISSEILLRDVLKKIDQATAGRIYQATDDKYLINIEGFDKNARVHKELRK